MKKFTYLMLTAGFMAVTSCSDDDGGNNTGVNSNLVGTYELSSFKVPVAQDYDSDGDMNDNLLLEGGCYNDSWIAFHADGTYDESYTSSAIAEGNFHLECDTQVGSGTYTRSGNTITTTRTSGEGIDNATYTFDSTAKTLKREGTGNYAGWNGTSESYTSLAGNLHWTFTKYTNDDNDAGATDNDENNVDANAFNNVTGNFDLTAFTVPTAQDWDNDGNPSTNLMTETECYSDSDITFNADGTYSEQVSRTVVVGGSGLTVECDSELRSGRWARHGNVVTTRQLSGGANLNTDYALSGSTISRTVTNGEYPSFNTVTSMYSTSNGEVTYTYSKQ